MINQFNFGPLKNAMGTWALGKRERQVVHSGEPQQLETGFFQRLRVWLFGYDIFISYKRADAQGYAAALEDSLKARDLTCFRDYREISPSEDFPARIEKALKRSQMLLVIGSPRAANPDDGIWVRREIETYLKHRSRAVVVKVAPRGVVYEAIASRRLLRLKR
jgi:hypothetical protein